MLYLRMLEFLSEGGAGGGARGGAGGGARGWR